MAEDPQERILSSSSTGGVTASLHYLGLMELATRLERRDVSPIEVTQAQLDRIATLDGALGSYALVTAEAALDDATAAEAEITAGRSWSAPWCADRDQRPLLDQRYSNCCRDGYLPRLPS
jgi:hypothetical protein